MHLKNKNLAVIAPALALMALAPPPTDPWLTTWNLVCPYGAEDDLPLPTSGGDSVSGTYESIALGDLDGDSEVDGLLVAGGEAHYIYGVEVFGSSMKIATGITSAVIQVDRAVAGHDVVLASGAAGLDQYEFDEPTGAFGPPTSVLSTLDSKDIPVLISGDLDGLRAEDVVFATSDKHVYLYTADGAAGALTALYDWYVPRAVDELRLVDWDDDGTNEVAVRSYDGLRVYEQSGGTPAYLPAAVFGPDGAICALEGTASQSEDFLLWARRDATDTFDELLMLNSSNTSPAGMRLEFRLGTAESLQDIDVVNLTTADGDGDGDLEILIGHTTFRAAICLANRGTGAPSFTTTPDGYRGIALGPDPSLGAGTFTAAPAFADVDSDGRADVFYACEVGDEVIVELEVPTFQGSGPPLFPSQPALVANVAFSLDATGPVELGDWYRLQLNVPAEVLTGPYDYIQVQVYNQPAAPAGIAATGWTNTFFDMGDLVLEMGDTASQIEVDINLTEFAEYLEDPWDDDQNLWIGVRFVHANPELNITAQTAWWVTAFTLDPNGYPSTYPAMTPAFVAYLTGLNQYISELTVTDFIKIEPPPLPGTASINLGAHVRAGRYVMFTNGPPVPAVAETGGANDIGYWQ